MKKHAPPWSTTWRHMGSWPSSIMCPCIVLPWAKGLDATPGRSRSPMTSALGFCVCRCITNSVIMTKAESSIPSRNSSTKSDSIYSASFYKKFTQFYPEGVIYDSPGLPKATLFFYKNSLNSTPKGLHIIAQGCRRLPWVGKPTKYFSPEGIHKWCILDTYTVILRVRLSQFIIQAGRTAEYRTRNNECRRKTFKIPRFLVRYSLFDSPKFKISFAIILFDYIWISAFVKRSKLIEGPFNTRGWLIWRKTAFNFKKA